MSERYFTPGDTAYKVMVYGGDEHDPSRSIEPGSEHWSETDAIAEARQQLGAKARNEADLIWSASVEKGKWVSRFEGNTDWLEWERDERAPARWLVLVDGRVVDEDA